MNNNSKLVKEKNQRFVVNKVTKVVAFVATLTILLATTSVVAFAAGIEDPVAMIDKLGQLVSNIVVAGGTIVTLFGVIAFATSFPSHDVSQKMTGVYTMVTGVILICAPFVVKYLTGK